MLRLMVGRQLAAARFDMGFYGGQDKNIRITFGTDFLKVVAHNW